MHSQRNDSSLDTPFTATINKEPKISFDLNFYLLIFKPPYSDFWGPLGLNITRINSGNSARDLATFEELLKHQEEENFNFKKQEK